jgi:hypothetical protein
MKEPAARRITATRDQLNFMLLEMKEREAISLRRNLTYCLIALFSINALSVLVIIFLVGLKRMELPEKLIMTLIAETVAQAATIFFSVTKFYFPLVKRSRSAGLRRSK